MFVSVSPKEPEVKQQKNGDLHAFMSSKYSFKEVSRKAMFGRSAIT
jgi:hypothetical protein